LWEAYSVSTKLIAEVKGEGKKSREGNGWNVGGAITGDGEGTEEEKEGDRHPPNVRSPPKQKGRRKEE